MPTPQYGTVVRFRPHSNWGLAQLEGTKVRILVHKDKKRRVVCTGQTPDDIYFRSDTPCIPNEGDELVLETRQTDKGGVAIAWAFRREWDSVRPATPTPGPVKTPAPSPEPASVPATPKVDPPLTFGEMLEALDFRFLHALLDAMEKKELTLLQLQEFVRNPPKGRRGEALWDEFHKRKTKSRDNKYGIAAFIKQVLVEIGFVIE